MRWDRKYQAPPERTGDVWRWHVMPWALEVGDRIVGTGMVIAGRPSYWESDLGSSAERAHYTYPLEGGASMTYTADSPCVSVIRTRGPIETPSGSAEESTR